MNIINGMDPDKKALSGNSLEKRRENPVTDCPLTGALAAVGGKWKLIIIYWLAESPKHFAGLKREMSSISQKVLTEQLRELEYEVRATRECLAEVPMDRADWKPHEKSMQLGYLAQLVADIPRWIQYTIEKGEIDFATYDQFKGATADELVAHFEKCIEGAKK